MSDEQTPADRPSAPRGDAAAPAWYPHPRQPGSLRYWNGVAWVEADATQGWYPDPADRSDLRFWTGRTWGQVLGDDPSRPAVVPAPDPVPAPDREPAHAPEPPAPAPEPALDPDRVAAVDAVLGASAPPPIASVAPNPRLAKAPDAPSSSWVTAVAAVACLVAGTVIGGVVVSTFLGGDEPSATRTVTATATATATGTGAPSTGTDADLTVQRVLSSRTLQLSGDDGKVEVRLLGLGDTSCDTNRPGKDLLKEQVSGQDAVISTITDPVTGEVGAYVDVAGQDVGQLLIEAGLATAAVGHPRASAYASAQAAATPYCTTAP